MSGLPAWVNATLQDKLEHVSRADLRAHAQAISDAYRAGGGSSIIRSDLDVLAYAIVRMPATYAAVRAALARTIDLIPGFEPQSILDAGAGPGTATWAAMDAWPSLRRATLIDSNTRLLDLARDILDSGGSGIAAEIVTGELSRGRDQAATADVVVASYALAELPPAALSGTVDALWRQAGRLLLIVEPGTVDGFQRILTCREHLLANGAAVIAPCSHENRCPLAEDARWCHFAARLPRSRDHMITKSGSVPFEDEKYCYLAAGKGFGDIARGRRVLATPKVSKAGVGLTLCAPDRPNEMTIPRRDKDGYRMAKRLDWGDAIGI